MSQKQLAEMTSIRPNAISEIVNNQRSTINREQLAIICKALEIIDMNEILELK
ncbi:helix-turn-helix transcriptional regulator [Lysinibacillus capsici]|uniref:helix-turn-helix domain-containing protein n=1 Tax=Lysinibacillus capsici TaxID=2115968 RepID=UPI0032E4E4DC